MILWLVFLSIVLLMAIRLVFLRIRLGRWLFSLRNCISRKKNRRSMIQKYQRIRVKLSKVIEEEEHRRDRRIRRRRIMEKCHQISHSNILIWRKKRKNLVKGGQRDQKIRRKIYLMMKSHISRISTQFSKDYCSIEPVNK